METKNIIRNVYLYLVSAVTLFMIMFAVVSMVNLGLRTWIFPQADDYNYSIKLPQDYCTPDTSGKQVCPPAEEREKMEAREKLMQDQQKTQSRQRDLVTNISMLLVAIPLFTYHWMVIRKEQKHV